MSRLTSVFNIFKDRAVFAQAFLVDCLLKWGALIGWSGLIILSVNIWQGPIKEDNRRLAAQAEQYAVQIKTAARTIKKLDKIVYLGCCAVVIAFFFCVFAGFRGILVLRL
jgi:hypothetical protein